MLKSFSRDFHWSSYLFQIVLILAFVSTSLILYLFLFITVFFKIYSLRKEGLSITRNNFIIFFFLLISLTFGLFINVFEYHTITIHYLISLVTFLFVIIYVRDLKNYYFASRYALITFQILAFIAIVKFGFSNFPVEVPLEKISNKASANGITSYFIILQTNYFIIKKTYTGKVPYWTSFLTLIIALTGYGRGSILAAFFLLILSLSSDLIEKSLLKKVLVFVFLSFGISFFVISYWQNISLFFVANTKLSQGLEDGHRSWILFEYLANLNLYSFFTGADYPEFVYSIYNGNPHNSFIRGHHFFGFPYLLFIILLPIFVICFNKKVPHRLLFFLCYLIVMFKSFTEPIIAPTLLDFYFFAAFYGLFNFKRYSSSLIDKNEARII